MNPAIKRIRELLRTEPAEIARTCESILDQGSPALMSFDLPLKKAQSIYLRRARLNEEQGNRIRGFSELAKALSIETAPQIGIQTVTVNSEEFSVFTTPDISRLIGVLIFPPDASSYSRMDTD